MSENWAETHQSCWLAHDRKAYRPIPMGALSLITGARKQVQPVSFLFAQFRFVPPPNFSRSDRNFLLGSNRNFSCGRDTRSHGFAPITTGC